MRPDAFRFIVACACATIIALSLWQLQTRAPTSAAVSVAQGGNVTELHLSQPDQTATLWKGIFGNLTQTAVNGTINTSITLNLSGTSPAVQDFNIALFNCTKTEIYATTETVNTSPGNGYLNSLFPATRTNVDTFLGVNSSNGQSASTAFPLNLSFEVGNNDHTLIATRINPATSNFSEGVLKRPASGVLVFVASIQFANGFLGTPTMYQMLLPQPNASNITWHFFVDTTDDDVCPFGEINITLRPPQPAVPREAPPANDGGGPAAAAAPSAPAFARPSRVGASAAAAAAPSIIRHATRSLSVLMSISAPQRTMETAVAVILVTLALLALLALMYLTAV